ncbi:MAG: hypothetical protein JW726_06500 [Anaerolineales bacterium]|nr:hypothetical protein [Anaerolineales bacterium]
MIKSGLIIGVVAAIFALIAGVTVSPWCGICTGLLTGLAAGYLAGLFAKPTISSEATKSGAIAGAIAGGVSIIGSLIASAINAATLDPADLAAIAEMLGVEMSTDATTIWVGQLVSGCCTGLLNVLLGAGIGAAGGALWYQISGKKAGLPPDQYPPVA